MFLCEPLVNKDLSMYNVEKSRNIGDNLFKRWRIIKRDDSQMERIMQLEA
jgi:hypothetical protein